MGKEAAFPVLIILGVFSLRICCFAASSFLNLSTVDESSLLSMKASFLNLSSVDESSLLSMKAFMNSDILAANWSKETSFCTWTGIICGMKYPERVIGINLSNMGLEGTIAREIGNLSFLRFVDISHNSFSALIPGEIGNLRRLRVLKMASNQLRGGIPQSLGLLGKLKTLDLSRNNLRGTVPVGFANWSQLQELSLSRNYLTGAFPASIGNLSNLEVFNVSENSFYGTVVSEMGRLSNLRILNLQANNLSGEVPQAIFNLSMLEFLSLRENSLSGTLPFSVDKGLPNIQQIFLGNIGQRVDPRANQFHGEIPSSISNLSKLITLDLSDNSFTHVPLNLGSLHQLEILNLEANKLMNNLSNPEQDFLSSLAACKNLKDVRISFNPITGFLPNSLGSSNLSESLETLKALSCRLLYPIPNEIGNLSNLLWLNVGYNHFTGAIPTTLGRLRSLRYLEIHGNRFDGSIPPVLCNLNDLYLFNLGLNNLSGELPSCFGNLSSLREIDMSDNEFNVNIASVLWFLNGVSNVKNVVALDLSANQLSGKIPSTISKFENLVRLSLARNKLIGPIGQSFTNLKDLQYLDLCCNNLSGLIPKSLEALSHLNYFDVSFNELRGKIPDRGCFVNFTADFFVGNKDLCGAPRFNVKTCRPISKTKWLLLCLSVVIVAIVTGLILILERSCVRKPFLSEDLQSDCNTLTGITFDYNTICAATCNFGEENLISRGGISSVYVGRFSDDTVYAVKVFKLDVDSLKSFKTETHVQSFVRHRNVLRIFHCCSQIDFKALVMTYMPNGDLEKWLYSANCSLNLFERLGILKDVASALEYLHDSHSPTIVHCDLNPRNIFLDEEMVARVADFGIGKVFRLSQQTEYSRNLGTVGYVAPERTSLGRISTKVDVYSYGILLMETLSRRKPTDDMFSGDFTMRNWMKESISDFVSGIVENELANILTITDYSRVTVESWLTAAVALALHCSTDSPGERPDMRYVLNRIARIHDNFKKLLDSFLA